MHVSRILSGKYRNKYIIKQCISLLVPSHSGWQLVNLWDTHRKRTMPVLDMAYDKPRMPLPMMALLRLKTDIPKEVLPSNCQDTGAEYQAPEKQRQHINTFSL